MNESSDVHELARSLTEDIAETLAYFGELGAEGLEDASALLTASDGATQAASASSPARQHAAGERQVPAGARPAQSPPARVSSALARNAQTEATKRTPIPRVPTLPTRGAAPPTNTGQTEMPRKSNTKTTQASETPPAVETLFGEITPMDEASLPRVDETLEDIRADIGECIRCPLSQSRTRVVHSDGNRTARLMFVGEAPGADEDAQGKPFVGRAGQLLNKIIEAIGLRREDVFIGNVNRCRPPQNRTPTLEEAKACKGFLLRDIAVVRPEVIVVLGNTAMKHLLDTKEGITKLRGQFQDYRGVKVMPTFHPAYLLRDPSKKRETWEDMKKVRDYLSESKS